MHKSKLYDMAGEIAMDKLMPKPVEITISMQGGGGLSDLREQRYNVKEMSDKKLADELAWEDVLRSSISDEDLRKSGLIRVRTRPWAIFQGEEYDKRKGAEQDPKTAHIRKLYYLSLKRLLDEVKQKADRKGESFPYEKMQRIVDRGMTETFPEGYVEPIASEYAGKYGMHLEPGDTQDFKDAYSGGGYPGPSFIPNLSGEHGQTAPVFESSYFEEIEDQAQSKKGGGGISDLNDSININGQPHRLVWANPQEERVLKKMGGSGKEVLGKPAYYYGSWGADVQDIENEMDARADESHALHDVPYTASDIQRDVESGKVSTFGMGETGLYSPDVYHEDGSITRGSLNPDYPDAFTAERKFTNRRGTPVQLIDRYSEEKRRADEKQMYDNQALSYQKARVMPPFPVTFAELGATRKENAEQDERAKIAYMNQHLANFPGGRRDPVTQKLYSADEDYERGIGLAGMRDALRTEYGGQQDVFGAMHKQAASLVQARLNEAINREIELTPEAEQVDSEEYREGIVDAVLSNPATALKEFGLTKVTKSTGLLPEAKVEERGWRDVLGDLATPMAVRVADVLSKGIPDLMDIWGTGEVNGRGVYIKKDGTIIPFTSDTERGNIESGSLRGENVVPKKLKRRPVQVASTKEVIEEESTPLEKILEARSKPSTLAQLNEEMQERVNRLYNRNIFT